MNYILSLIFYTRCDLNPLYFLIGADDNKTKFIVQTGYCLISLLSYAALKSIFLMHLWKMDMVYQTWTPFFIVLLLYRLGPRISRISLQNAYVGTQLNYL